MADAVKLIECPRDAWQGLAHRIPTQDKRSYLQALLDAGCRHMDAVSFVSPTAVPQLADSESVLAGLLIPPQAEIIGIVVNERGAERAVATGKVTTLGYPHSISEQFLMRNQRLTVPDSLATLSRILARGRVEGSGTVAYLSMAFGNPYGEPWSLAVVLESCMRMADCGVEQLSLADTVGVATPAQVAEVVAAVQDRLAGIEVGLHLHARPEAAPALLLAAWHAGCRRFDAALGGFGGCPFAQDALVGNIATETVCEVLQPLAPSATGLQFGFRQDLLARSRQLATTPAVTEAQ